MATLREIKRRIDSVKNTQQITSAMKMVAAAKLRSAQQQLIETRPFADSLFDIISRIAFLPAGKAHPCFATRRTKRVCYVLITADRGLCGSFNSNLIRAATKQLEQESVEKGLLTIGKKGFDHFRRTDIPIVGKYINFFSKLSFQHAAKMADSFLNAFEKRQHDRIVFIYNEFTSIGQQRIAIRQFLPIIPNRQSKVNVTTLFEPHPHKVLDTLLSTSLQYALFNMLLESVAAEQWARMTAMETASENAAEMIERLLLHYNKTRQAAITTELTEIVSGVEALKG